jgi:chromate transporter
VLGVYQILPGPEATELCIYFGMKARGRIGGLLAGTAFLLPGFLLMLLFTWLYLKIGTSSSGYTTVLTGIQAAVIALIVFAVFRIAKHAVQSKVLLGIAIISGIIQYFGVPFYIALFGAGLVYALLRIEKKTLAIIVSLCVIGSTYFFLKPVQATIETETIHNQAEDRNLASVFITGFKAGSLTFGGAYTAIPFVREDAVERLHWMNDKQFLDGIALSGILPAPLIIFSTFVGYFGGGWPGAIIITFAVFLPAFLITLIGHHAMEKLVENKKIHAFLDGVTAGVVGLIGITAIQFMLYTLTSWQTILVFLVAIFLLYKVKTRLVNLFVITVAAVLMYSFSFF